MDPSLVCINELAQACAHSADAAEWEEFLCRTTPLASLVAARIARLWMNAPSATLVDDIVQEVYLKLCEQERRILREFEPRGEDSFLGLMRIVTASVANDYFRRLYSAKRGGKVVNSQLSAEPASCPANGDGESNSLQRSVLFAQLDRKLRDANGAVSQRDRGLFWLYYGQGFTADEIAALPSVGLTGKGVESALRRVVLWLRAAIEQRRPEHESGPQGVKSSLSQGDFTSYPLNRRQR
jgi:RNA polymerase sigma-70 factor (ECF subfamily)